MYKKEINTVEHAEPAAVLERVYEALKKRSALSNREEGWGVCNMNSSPAPKAELVTVRNESQSRTETAVGVEV